MAELDRGVRQFSTFYVADRLYGIDVMRVQEITKALPITAVPLAPNFVHGLINLRGQISTAVGLRELFMIEGVGPEEKMNVVCRIEDVLFSFVVDKIGDVMEVAQSDFEPAPDTVASGIRKFMTGVYKTPNDILSVIDIDKLAVVVLKAKGRDAKGSNEATAV